MKEYIYHAQRQNPEYDQVYDFLHRFFDVYYTKRDMEQVLNMLSDNCVCVGMASDEVAQDKLDFAAYIKDQVAFAPGAIPYTIQDYFQRACGTDCWIGFARLDLKFQYNQWSHADYHMRLTVTIHKENGNWLFDSIHVSEATDTVRDVSYPTGKIGGTDFGNSSLENQKALGKLISRLVPGGVISCKIADGYPMTVANEQFLTMLGYAKFAEFMKDINGFYIECIHPSDREKYEQNVQFAIATGKQCECDYRLKQRGEGYVWVHDVGWKALDDQGQTVMFSALVDISKQYQRQKMLEYEAEIDPLTGAYNRKGIRRQMEKRSRGSVNWIFLMTDLDHFKRVNDFYGHKQGDQILRYVAQELIHSFGEGATVCRLGGDEFAVFIAGYTDFQQVTATAKKVSERYRSYLDQVCPKSQSTMSVGGVYGNGPIEIDKIYEISDENLYDIKRSIKGEMKITEV